MNMFNELEKINMRPKPFEFYTADELWADGHTSQQMLQYHLNGDIDVSSRKVAFIDRSVAWITKRFSLGEGTRVADFGCGPGLYTTRLARTGAQVTGIDFSQNSIKYAQDSAAKEGLTVRYVNQNYLGFDTDDRFDLIIMIMCDFCALSPEQRKTLLLKFHTILNPGGCVLLDVYSLPMFDQREEAMVFEKNMLNNFWSPHEYYCFLHTFKYEQAKVVLDKYTIIEETRMRTVYNWLQYFSPETLKQEFADNGFLVEELYGDVSGTPFHQEGFEIAVSAKKP